MAQEIGIAYVTVAPSAKGFGKSIEGQVDTAIGNSEKKTNGFFSRIGTGLKVVGGAVAGVVTAIGAIALTGGISRALNIEDAQAKLKGLGHDTRAVEAIMTDALASVRGTAYGLDTAATVAATAVAAGIKPGQELEKYLRLTADAATIAGVSMEEMGSILNKATTAGKVYTQELNQLADRGLPIFQWLQEEYQVTAEELRKMVAAGEVDAATFRKVIEENIGGAALASGDTTRGAFANMRAAMSRFGVALLGDGLGAAKTFFSEITIIFDGLTTRVGPWVEKFQAKLGGMFQIEGMGDRFLDWLDRSLTALSNGPIPQLLSALAPIIPALSEMAQLVGAALGDAFKELGAALAPVLPMLAEALADAVVELAPALTDLLVALIPLIPSLVQLLAAVVPLAAELTEFLLPAIVWIVEAVAGFVEGLGGLIGLLSGNKSLGEFTVQMLQMQGPLGDLIREVGLGAAKFGAFMHQVIEAVKGIAAVVIPVITGVADFFRETWDAIGRFLGGALAVIVGLVTGNMDAVQSGILRVLSTVKSWWENTWGGLVETLRGVWSRVSSAVSGGIESVISLVSSLPSRVMSAVAALPGLLVAVGRQMIQGLINGVASMIQNAVNAVRNVGGAMLDGVKSFLGIASPSRVFRDEVGKMVGLGLLDGISDTSISGRIDSAVQHLVKVPAMGGGAGTMFPPTVTLVDRDGSILALLDVLLNESLSSADPNRLNASLGFRR